MNPPDVADQTYAVPYSETFNDETAQITYQSADGIRFRIHTVYLKAHTEGLVPLDGSSLKEMVQLTEPASILELLFKFIYPIRSPTLAEEEFDIVKKLGEAAEKYQVFPAMYACTLYLQDSLPSHAVDILGYGLKHDYIDLIDAAAPYAIDVPLPTSISCVPFEFHMAWSSYYDQWLNKQKRALTTHLPQNNPDMAIIPLLAGSLSAVRNHRATFGAGNDEWRDAVEADVKSIRRMSEVIGGSMLTGSAVDTSNAAWSYDTTIQSCDGVQHPIDLETFTACAPGLPPFDGQDITISETSSTIQLLIQFTRPVRSPDLWKLSFPQLKNLAFAAEKYTVHQAMAFCHIFMKKALHKNPKDVFHYAAMHSYLDILDAAAPLLLGPQTPFADTVKLVPPPLVSPWACYYQRWQDASRAVIEEAMAQEEKMRGHNGRNGATNKKGYCECEQLFVGVHLRPVLRKLLRGPAVLRDLDSLFEQKNICGKGKTALGACRVAVEKLITEIQPLSSTI